MENPISPITYTPIDIETLQKNKMPIKWFILGALLFVLLIGSSILILSSKSKNNVVTTKKMVPTATPVSTISATIAPSSVILTIPPAQITSSTVIIAPTLTPTSAPNPTQGPTLTPTLTPTPPDTEPPHTNIYYPVENGEITYKRDGKVCAITTAPNDNRTPPNQIQTQYAFDADQYNEYVTQLAYLCKDVLANGSHILKVRSKDAAGNVEPEQIRHFNVNIEGN